MRRATNIGRFGILVVGYGVAAALAATSPTAAADPAVPFNPLPLIPDPLVAPAEVPSTLNLAISVDGFSLLSSGSAEAESGTGGIAIAYGADSHADAGSADDPGLFDTAFADGANSQALAGTGDFDSSFATGTYSIAETGPGNFNAASANGAFAEAHAGGSDLNSSSFDYASSVGNDANAFAGSFQDQPDPTAPSAGDVAITYDPFGTENTTAFVGNGIGDLGVVIGDNSDAYSGLSGSFDIAAAFGDNLGAADATGGNFLLDILPSL
jgi:hypothetical protein